jgi:hypothetical protein
MDTNGHPRRLWPFVVSAVAAAAIAFATAGAAMSDDGAPSSGKDGAAEAKPTPALSS